MAERQVDVEMAAHVELVGIREPGTGPGHESPSISAWTSRLNRSSPGCARRILNSAPKNAVSSWVLCNARWYCSALTAEGSVAKIAEKSSDDVLLTLWHVAVLLQVIGHAVLRLANEL